MRALVKIIIFLLTLAISMAVIALLAQLTFGHMPRYFRHSGIGHVTFYILFVLSVFFVQKVVNRSPIKSLGFQTYPGWQMTVFKGWIVGVLSFLGYTLLMDSFGIIDIRYQYGLGRVFIALIVACTAFGIALTEEVLFRGFFLQTMTKDMPKWIAVILTGLIFVVFHKLGSIQDFWTIPYDAMLGGGIFCLHLWLTVAFFKTKRLFLPIGIHAGLVYAKVVFRYLKITEVQVQDSFLLGLGGDARRGFLAWGLFLCGILILRFLIGIREKKALQESSA